ncbi:MAG TPA: hypothetical protein VIO64_12580 [Pseudobacteroides sp.]|uniref:hypothetical protein n=1 Tax=Pseudobacteroides sp. TaxID=1968840 RepID=UPI002F95FEF9
MSLTSKELMLVQDNIEMTQNSIKIMESCAELCNDAQIKTLCQQMVKDHRNDLQTLIKHINSATIQ